MTCAVYIYFSNAFKIISLRWNMSKWLDWNRVGGFSWFSWHNKACVFIYYVKRLAQLTVLLLFSLFTRWSLTLCWSSWPLHQWAATDKMCGRNLWKRPKPTWWKSQSVSQCCDFKLFLQKKQRSRTIGGAIGGDRLDIRWQKIQTSLCVLQHF